MVMFGVSKIDKNVGKQLLVRNIEDTVWDFIKPTGRLFGVGTHVFSGKIKVDVKVVEERWKETFRGFGEVSMSHIILRLTDGLTERLNTRVSYEGLKELKENIGRYYTIIRRINKMENVRYKVERIVPVYMKFRTNITEFTEAGIRVPLHSSKHGEIPRYVDILEVFPVKVTLRRNDTDRTENVYGTLLSVVRDYRNFGAILTAEFIPQYIPAVETLTDRFGNILKETIKTRNIIYGVAGEYVKELSTILASKGVPPDTIPPQLYPNFPLPTDRGIAITTVSADKNNGVFRLERLFYPPGKAEDKAELMRVLETDESIRVKAGKVEVSDTKTVFPTIINIGNYTLGYVSIPIALTEVLTFGLKNGKLVFTPGDVSGRVVAGRLSGKRVENNYGTVYIYKGDNNVRVAGVDATPGYIITPGIYDSEVNVFAKVHTVASSTATVSAGVYWPSREVISSITTKLKLKKAL